MKHGLAALIAVVLGSTCQPALGQSLEAAYENNKTLAEQGDADAQFFMGFVYEYGYGVLQDDAEAVKWYRLAAERGDEHAKDILSHM